MHNQIVWQPLALYQPHHDFDILLDRIFVGEMLMITLGEKGQRRMNALGEETLRRFRYSHTSPYLFEGNTGLVSQITIDGGRGTWLEMEGMFGQIPDVSRKEPLKYTTHNMDSTSDTLCLLALFDQWITYAEVFE